VQENECIFCNIISGKIKAQIVYEHELFLVFKDIFPKAKVHLLFVPKQHIVSLSEIMPEHRDVIFAINSSFLVLARQFNLESGFRVVVNTGVDGGQQVPHLHYHFLGGNLATF
jgi:histidine triad (HIT) family protein